MPRYCRTIEKLLPGYLDGCLKNRQVIRVERHLAQCPVCQDALARQKAWLELRLLLRQSDAAAEVPPGLNARIIAALQSSTTSTRQPETRQPRIVMTLAGALAAVVVLVAAWQLLPLLLPLTGQAELASMETTLANDVRQTQDNSSALAPGQDQGNTSSGFGNWIIINTDDVKKGLIGEDIESDYGSQADGFYSCLAELEDLLAEAGTAQLISRGGSQPMLVILAAYTEQTTDAKRLQMENLLSTCTNPVKIEIIKADQLIETLAAIDPALPEPMATDFSVQPVWILILIGA